nr:transcription factor IIIA-like [Tanacetum cinerariifolium]
MRFAYKHVTDNHEKTGRHVYKVVDSVDADVEFQSRPMGILSISLLQVHYLGWFISLKRSGSHGLLHLKSTGHTGRCTQKARVRRMEVGEFANFSIWNVLLGVSSTLGVNRISGSMVIVVVVKDDENGM